MRIEAYSQISQLYKAEKTKALKAAGKANKNDKVEISQIGRDYQIAKNAVAQSEDVREDLVSEYKKRIQSGEYNVSAKDFAEKVIEKYNSMMP